MFFDSTRTRRSADRSRSQGSRHANLVAVVDEIDVEGIIAVWGNELTEDLVSFFVRCLFRDPAEALGHAKDVGVHEKCGEGKTNIYST